MPLFRDVLYSDPALLERIGAATALEVRATGIPYVFAPCIAVCRDPRWGRCYESYSEDPEVVRSLTTIIDGLQGKPPKGWKGPYVQNRYSDSHSSINLYSSINFRSWGSKFAVTMSAEMYIVHWNLDDVTVAGNQSNIRVFEFYLVNNREFHLFCNFVCFRLQP